nr:AraC family transcriptional regulator [Enterocloster clostridioformis]
MQDEEKQGDSYCQIQLRSLLHQILVVLGRCQETRGEGHALEETEEAMVSAARYMNQHYQEGLTLGEVAAFANMSPTYFSKKFKGSTGLCFKEYLNYIRVQKASDMLRNTDLSVTGVAMACGFSDGNYFGDVFRRLTGVSPREYRKGQTVLNQGRVRFMSGSDTGISP